MSNLSSEHINDALRQLSIASLIIPHQQKLQRDVIETRYELIPLTRKYIYTKLLSHPEINRVIMSRMDEVQNLVEEAEKARKYYRYSLRDMEAGTEAEKIAATWAITAYQKYQAGDYETSISNFKKAAEIAPNFPAVYRNWATLESDAGFYEKANELMKKATTLSPDDPRLWFVWGNIEKRWQRLDRAYRYLKKALELSPNDAPILGALGEVEKRRENFEEADKLLRQSIKSPSPLGISQKRHEIICYTSLADNLGRLAEKLSRERQIKEALVKLKEAYELSSKSVELGGDFRAQCTFREISLRFGNLMEREGEFENAKQYFKKSIVERPRRAKERKITERACYSLVIGLLKEGNLEDAKMYYQIGLKALMPGSKFYKLYKDLGLEFEREQHEGKIFRIAPNRGYGFVDSSDFPGQSIFLHISEVLPNIPLYEFEKMEGSIVRFIVQHDTKGLAAKRAWIIKNR